MDFRFSILRWWTLIGLMTCTGCGVEERYVLRGPESPHSLAVYQRALANDPADRKALFGLGWLSLQQDRTRRAAEVLAELARETPGDAAVHYYLGVALAKEHRKKEAIESFEQALDLAPNLVEGYWALALLQNERGDGYQEAIEKVEAGLELAEASGYGHFVLGFLQSSRGYNDKALGALLRATELDPGLAHAHYYLALIYLRKQDDKEAVAAMERTIATDPGYTEAYYSLGTLYARMGKVEEGERMIQLFQQLSNAAMDEDHYRRLLYRRSIPLGATKRAATYFNLGLVYMRRSELKAALEQFQSALDLDSTYAEANHNVGVVYSLEGLHEEAEAYFERAVRWKTDYALAFKNLGNNQLVLGEYQSAVEAFRRAITLDAKMVEALNGLGTALIQQGRVAEGKAARAKAVSLGVQK